MTTCTYYVGDALTVLRTLPDASADLALSSPPFLSLRDYLPRDHPDKAKEMGSEPTPGEFLDALLDVVEELARVLGPHGTLAFELGDTYAGSGGAGGDYAEGGMREGQPMFRQGYLRNDRPSRVPQETPKAAGKPASRTRPDGNGKVFRGGVRQVDKRGEAFPLDKSLCLIPELFRIALVYGFNPLTGRQTPRWRARNVVRWCRPNPPVGALGDKVRPATSDIVVACKSRTRYFDLDAVRGPGSANTHSRTAKGVASRPSSGKTADDERRGGNFSTLATLHDTNGAPPLDHWWFDEDTFDQDAWMVPTEGYKGSHYATWPRDLLIRPILAMCPERVCTVCGEPSRRIAETTNAVGEAMGRRSWRADPANIGAGHTGEITGKISSAPTAERQTLGWTDCACSPDGSHWRPGLVLDCFAGTGTTLAVAQGHGRSAIGIDLDERNADLARARVGMFLEVVADVRPDEAVQQFPEGPSTQGPLP